MCPSDGFDLKNALQFLFIISFNLQYVCFHYLTLLLRSAVGKANLLIAGYVIVLSWPVENATHS